jgi:GNAT superfamily N-acetyltransferase
MLQSGVVATFSIRDAAMADIEAVREVFRRSSLSVSGDRPHHLANPDVLELSDLSVRQQRTRVAVVGDRVVGFATTLDTEDGIELEDLFVDPDWMGKGVGRDLVADVVAVARARRADRVNVTANRDALGFYERVGFVVDGEVETHSDRRPTCTATSRDNRVHRPHLGDCRRSGR